MKNITNLKRLIALVEMLKYESQMDEISDDILMELLEEYFGDFLLCTKCKNTEDSEEVIEF